MLVPARADRRPDAPSCTLWYVAMRGGLQERSGNYVLSWVRLLIANEGFPPPLPAYVLSTGRKIDGVTLRSTWVREAVDAWFDGFLPPQLVAVVEDRRAARDAATLDARAVQLAAA